jgi:hypothetical protein
MSAMMATGASNMEACVAEQTLENGEVVLPRMKARSKCGEKLQCGEGFPSFHNTQCACCDYAMASLPDSLT